MCSIDLRKERQKGINTADSTAGSGPGPDRYKPCVYVCVEKRGKGSGRLSKANRKASLPQVQLLCVRWGGGGGW